MPITPYQYQEMARRCLPKRQPTPAHGIEVESDLHQQIMDECERRGWLFFHGAMCRRTHRTEGEPDFIILRESGLLLVECKSRSGKLSPAQQAVAAHARKLGHEIHVVRSIEEFTALC